MTRNLCPHSFFHHPIVRARPREDGTEADDCSVTRFYAQMGATGDRRRVYLVGSVLEYISRFEGIYCDMTPDLKSGSKSGGLQGELGTRADLKGYL